MFPEYDENAVAIASGAILYALLDTLLANGTISATDARDILGRARLEIGLRTKNDLRDRAAQLLTAVWSQLAKSNV